MTREQLRALGLTDEQIEGVMREHGIDVQALNNQIATSAATIATLQGQIAQNQQSQQEPQNQQNQSNQINNESNEEVTTLREQLANMQSEMNKKDIAVYASSKGLSGDTVDTIVKQFGASDVDAAKKAIDSLSQLLSDSNKQAIADFEKNSQNNTPGVGGSTSSGSDNKTSAENIASNLFGASKNSTSVISHYLSGGK